VGNICIPHIDDVIASTSVYPDTLFSGGAATRTGATNFNDICTNLFNGTAGPNLQNSLYYLQVNNNFANMTNIAGSLTVTKIVVGALGVSGFSSGGGVVNGSQYLSGLLRSNGSIAMGGITLFGNTILRPSSGWTNVTSDIWGHSTGLVSAGVASKGNLNTVNSFATGGLPTPGLNYNYAENNIQLMNNARTFPVGTGTDAPGADDNTWNLSGPVLYWVQNNILPDSSVTYPAYRLWNSYAAIPTGYPGFKGRFGNGSGVLGAPGVVASSIFFNLEERFSEAQYYTATLNVYSGTGVTPPYVSPASPGGLTAPTIWNLLNLTVQSTQVGVNINNGHQFNTNMII